jgi:RNA polymerase sigma-70 factor (ECF subfamily)
MGIGNLMSHAVSLTGDKVDAEDLVQETALRALKNKDKFRENTNFQGWLYMIMKNLFLNSKRRSNRITAVEDMSIYQKQLSYAPIDKKMEYRDALDGLKGLTRSLRRPLLMHTQGFKYQEIAERLDVPLGTVKSRIFFAKRKMSQIEDVAA